MCPSDPLACNELGVLTYKNQQYSAAEQWLLRALELVPGRLNAGQYAPHLVLNLCWMQRLSIRDGAAFCPSTHTNNLDARDDPFHSQEMGQFPAQCCPVGAGQQQASSTVSTSAVMM